MKAGLLKTIGLGITLMSATMAFGQEAKWSMAGATSIGRTLGCDQNSVEFIENGNDTSIVLKNMASSMTAGDNNRRNLHQFATCRVFLKVKVPKGYMISELSTNVVGGVEKSKHAFGFIGASITMFRGLIDVRGKIVGGLEWIDQWSRLQRIFKWGQEVSEPLLTLSDSKTASRHSSKRQCQLTSNSDAEFGVELKLDVNALRARADQTALVSVDTVDNRVSLDTTLIPCR